MIAVQAVTALVQHGASVSAQIMGSSQTPWLSRGSTALHIAAARGSHTVAQALLEAQGQDPGVLLVQQWGCNAQLSVMPAEVALHRRSPAAVPDAKSSCHVGTVVAQCWPPSCMIAQCWFMALSSSCWRLPCMHDCLI